MTTPAKWKPALPAPGPCPHCPDGHADPTSRPWGVYVGSERDGDGQPTHLHVAPTAGQHVAESDAEWVRQRLNAPTVDREAVVCICGSTRFREQITQTNRDLTLEGQVVLAPGVFGHSGDVMTDEQKDALDVLHLRKIDLSERVVVVAPGGYIGESTSREIAYAESTGKPVEIRTEFEPVATAVDREAMARLIEPDAWNLSDLALDEGSRSATRAAAVVELVRRSSLAKADRILALSDLREAVARTIYTMLQGSDEGWRDDDPLWEDGAYEEWLSIADAVLALIARGEQ